MIGQGFGLFGAGASIGAVLGPSIPVFLGDDIGVYNLLLIAALILVLIVPLIFFLESRRAGVGAGSDGDSEPISMQSIGGRFFDGFKDFVSHRFLLIKIQCH